LLKGFFEFVGQFDFKKRCMSLVTGEATVKPDHSAMYVENPLDRTLNVTRNVSADEVDRLVKHCRECAWSVESSHSTLPEVLLPPGSSMRFDTKIFSRGVSKFHVKNLFALGVNEPKPLKREPSRELKPRKNVAKHNSDVLRRRVKDF
jgi:hypothetical protein